MDRNKYDIQLTERYLLKFNNTATEWMTFDPNLRGEEIENNNSHGGLIQ